MRKYIKPAMFIALTISFNGMASIDCSGLTSCERKFCELEFQIEKAKQANNQYKVDGLKKALKSARLNCTDEHLKSKLQHNKQETEHKISELNDKLERARQDGNSDKVIKYQEKLKQKKTKLEKINQELYEYS